VFTKLKELFAALYLVNKYGYQLSKVTSNSEKKRLRLEYASAQLNRLNISVKITDKEKLPQEGQYLLVCNHKSIIDPPLVEALLAETNIYGVWVAKKELYNSIFFGSMARNGGSILLDREQAQMSAFFSEVKKHVKEGRSIFIFPEGTRNKSSEVIAPFKEGARIIALKNRLPILPVFIKTDAGEAVRNGVEGEKAVQEVEIVVGSLIEYKDKTPLEEAYKNAFGLV
jgi:1-acyl-sn-glycerol-3-phosphate acyltransferase